MTITLHWWMIPVALVCWGAITLFRAPTAGFEGIGNAMGAIALFAIAAAICLGHWL